MNRKLLLILATPIIVVLSTQLIFYFKVKWAIDDFIEKVGPMANIQYQGIIADPSGEMGVEGLSIKPMMMPDSFYMQKLSLKFDDPWALLEGSSRIKEQKLPEHFGVELIAFELDLTADYLDTIEQQIKSSFIGFPIDGLGCGDIEFLSNDELVEMGYSKLKMDVVFDAALDHDGNKVLLDFRNKFHDAYTFDGKAELKVEGFDAVQAAQTPRLAKLDLRYVDEGYVAKRNAYCANQHENGMEDFVEAHGIEVTNYFGSRGFEPKEQLINEYKRFLESPGDIYLGFTPQEPFDLDRLQAMSLYEAEDVANMLGMSLLVNGVIISQPIYKRVDSSRWESAKRFVNEEETKSYNRRSGGYVAFKLSRIHQYIGKSVKITERDGKATVGKIRFIDDSGVHLERIVRTGKVVYPIPMSDIKKTEVFRYR
tara:strand:+ start:2945 stop:4219 length:1275 start_codon:yes stop_codon:yes gene_type:complete